MAATPETLLKLQAEAVNVSNTAVAKAIEGVQKLAEFNMATAKAAVEESTSRIQALLTAKDPKALSELLSRFAQPETEKATAYAKGVYEITSQTSADLSALFEKQIADSQSQVFAAIDAFAKNAPAGSEGVVSLLKSMATSASAAYEQAGSASKKFFETAQSNLAGMTKTVPAATKATRR